LTIFLIAKAAGSGKVKATSADIRAKKGFTYIHRLEFMLIATCLELNPDLTNVHGKGFLQLLHVPGYFDKSAQERSPAAKALHKLLKS
jgi:hypothetical protein